MLTLLGFAFVKTRSNIQREAKMAVNMEERIPKIKVTAKPLMGPVPNW
jgi:hypothetical protein